MAKEIPYLKFSPTDWSNGDLTLEELEIQGLFINICAYYWSKDCILSIVNLKKRFRGLEEKIDELFTSNNLKKIDENVAISFLNEQLESKELQKIVNLMNGRKGGRPKNKKTEEKPNGFNFANRNETESETESKPIYKERDKDKEKENKHIPFNFRKSLEEKCIDNNLVSQWMVVRKKLKAVNTEIAFNRFISEVIKSGKSIDYVLKLCIEKSWRGFSADWIPYESISENNPEIVKYVVPEEDDKW